MELKGSKTEQNLRSALAGESIARNRYTYFATQARKEGNEEIAQMFDKLAVNESTHGRLWYTALNGPIKGTLDNLQDAAKGEFQEWSHMYPDFAKTAREEGFEELAVMFEHVAAIEKDHEKQFMEAIIRMKTAPAKTNQPAARTAAQSDAQPAAPVREKLKQTKVGYRCMFCGAVFSSRLDVCPVCEAIGSFETCTITE